MKQEQTTIRAAARHGKEDSRSVKFIYERTENGAESGTNYLTPKLSFGRCSKKMARLEVLHEIASLKGTLSLG